MMTMTGVTERPVSLAWGRVAFAMFAVGWGANQFSPMLIVYRHELSLSAAAVAGLFAVYAVTLVPGLLIGGPASDRYGRRAVVLPFVALSPVATLLLILAPRELAVLAASRALAGMCSGVVFGAATAWVQELSSGAGARRAALALTAGFGLGPVVAAVLAQWAPDPLRLPYLPHLVIGITAVALLIAVPGGAGLDGAGPGRRRVVPAAVRSRAFWLTVAPAAPLVFGSVAVAIVVLPEEVTSAWTLSAGFAGLMTALAFAAGVLVQPLARRLPAHAGNAAGLCCGAAAAGFGVLAVHGPDKIAAGVAAALLGLAYGLCLVSGLRQAEQLAGPGERGAVAACYYALAYLGFGVPYLVAGLNAVIGDTATFGVLAGAGLLLAVWVGGYRPVRATG
jgi:predicted MFS family arabinose efflux permease